MAKYIDRKDILDLADRLEAINAERAQEGLSDKVLTVEGFRYAVENFPYIELPESKKERGFASKLARTVSNTFCALGVFFGLFFGYFIITKATVKISLLAIYFAAVLSYLVARKLDYWRENV